MTESESRALLVRKTGTFPKEFSVWLHAAFDSRLQGDYRELVVVTAETAAECVRRADAFLAGVRRLLDPAPE
jgi:uncharacterized protein (UPF0332 family)